MIRGAAVAACGVLAAFAFTWPPNHSPEAQPVLFGSVSDRMGHAIEGSRSAERTTVIPEPSPATTPSEPPPPPPPPEPVAAPAPAPAPAAPAAPVTSSSGGLPALLVTIRANESGGNYAAYNPTGCSDENGTWSCGGAYQMSEQYAAGWAAEAGYPGQSSQAQTWDPAVQDAVALYKFYATNPDGSMWCSFTEYC